MDKQHYDEMLENLKSFISQGLCEADPVYLFGHCEATLTVADELIKLGIVPDAILDNSDNKQGIEYRDIKVCRPAEVVGSGNENSVVLIATRFYESMRAQLLELGYKGRILKVVDYNTYSEYSLSEDTISRKMNRVQKGREALDELRRKYPDTFIIFCPFAALGDIYFCMSYLPHFMEKRNIEKALVCVVGKGCLKTAGLFEIPGVVVSSFGQKILDEMVQASLYYRDENTFIAHQDRPYVVRLHQALQIKCIPLEKIYCCGIFGLSPETAPIEATKWNEYPGLSEIEKGKTVVVSPYAKSVTALPDELWNKIVDHFKCKGYVVLTNVSGDEEPLTGTKGISPDINEMRSIVEAAGTFIGIRSGMCDVLRSADCRKIALFPDYNYGDTKWKSIDMYRLEGFENIVYRGNDSEVLEAL